MANWHLRPNRKATGGKLSPNKKKHRADRGSEFLQTKIGTPKRKIDRVSGGNFKARLLSTDQINVAGKDGKAVKAKVISEVENKANPNYVRRNILTKGAVVKTDLGLVKITSRVGQEGSLNGVLVEAAKK